MEGKYIPSLLAAIGNVIEKHMQQIGYIEGKVSDNDLNFSDVLQTSNTETPVKIPKACANCGDYGVKVESGCEVCISCGHSKCG